jgi:hypothetical protein
MPPLTPVIDTLDAVPEPVRQYYEPKDGKFALTLTAPPVGFVPSADLATANSKVVEFRNNNVALLKEVEELRPIKAKVGDLDIDAAKKAVTELDALKKTGVGKPDDIQAQIQAALKPIQETLAQANAAAAANLKRADDAVFRSQLGEKFAKVGGKPAALDFVLGQAQSIFEVKDGIVRAQPTKFSSEKPGEPLGMDEWLVGFAKANDFAFGPSTGSGAAPQGGGTGTTHPVGQLVLKDPTPSQLGDPKIAKQIREGTLRVEHSNSALP